MFEAAELGLKVSKREFQDREPGLRTGLLDAQRRARDAGVPVIVILTGVEGAGKGDVVNRLYRWLDVRGLRTHAFWDDTPDHGHRPYYWRFWQAMPETGMTAIMFGSWYRPHVVDRIAGRIDQAEYDQRLRRIADFERLLTDDGTLLVKLWFHLTQKEQAKRLKKDREAGRILSPDQEAFARHYDRILRHAERAIRTTDVGSAPWHIIDSADPEHRDLAAGEALLMSLNRRLESAGASSAPAASRPVEPSVTVLDRIDLDQSLEQKEYEKRLRSSQDELWNLAWRAHEKRLPTVVVFEGWDAAGKGSALRRLTQAIDARLHRTISIGAPTDEEKAHHYLWRFWRQLPPGGYMTFYDRSWYGRVLVERVEGYARPEEWRRAYHEINSFEEQMVGGGVVLLKFWIHISQEEQLRRFRARERTEWKRYKITDDDWRNREKWNEYRTAVNEMIARTSTGESPWTLVAGNDKKHARVQILETIAEKLERALGRRA